MRYVRFMRYVRYTRYVRYMRYIRVPSADLSRFLSADELRQHDVLTYTFGDYHRLYLRGQFTSHKYAAVR